MSKNIIRADDKHADTFDLGGSCMENTDTGPGDWKPVLAGGVHLSSRYRQSLAQTHPRRSSDICVRGRA
jgi:hypothetical protein